MTSGPVSDIDHPAAHPLVALVDGLDELREEAAGGQAWTLPPAALGGLLERLAVHQNWLNAVQLQLLREADRHQIGDAVGAANTAGWWANTTRTNKPTAHKMVALAAELDRDEHAPTAAAITAGAVSVEQAAVIVHAVDALPSDLVEPALRRDAEAHLVGLAAHHDPRELRLLGRRILDVIAPQISEAHEQTVLEREEHDALATATFVMNPDGHGSMIGRFKIPMLAGEILATHLRAIAAPRHRAAADTGFETDTEHLPQPTSAKVARPLRLGQAFVEYLETKAKTGIPKAGGIPATVVVTMTTENLLSGTGAATLGSGERISASEARRLICQANAYSAFLGTSSTELDLGRRTRFHTEPQRIAIGLRDKGCVVKDCDWPPTMSHIHHPQPWSTGGNTSYQNGMMICPHHHTLAHDNRYQMNTHTHGEITFTRRT
jgi:hypothetical protein